MSEINKPVSINDTYEMYEKFVNVTLTENFLLDLPVKIEGYEFQGLNMDSMFEDIKKRCLDAHWNQQELFDALATLMAIFHIRGPNINNLSIDYSKGAEAIKKFNKIKAVLGLASKVDGRSNNITLPRLAVVFPNISLGVWNILKAKAQAPIRSTMVGFDNGEAAFPIHVPSFFDAGNQIGDNAKVLMMHVLYQTHLSNLVQWPSRREKKSKSFVPKPIGDFFFASIKYSTIARNGSRLYNSKRTHGAKIIVDDCKKTTVFEVISAMNVILKDINTTSIDCNPTTTYEIAAVYMAKRTISIPDIKMISEALENKTFEEIKTMFPIE